MHLKLCVGDSALKCLLDSGASHLFISQAIVDQFGPNTYNAESLNVCLANGSTVRTAAVAVVPVRFAGGAEQLLECRVLP